MEIKNINTVKEPLGIGEETGVHDIHGQPVKTGMVVELYANQYSMETVFDYIGSKTTELLNAWCKEANVSTPVGYNNDLLNHQLNVFTMRPGMMIGRTGSLVNKYQAKFSEAYHVDYSIRFIEIRDGFANLNKTKTN